MRHRHRFLLTPRRPTVLVAAGMLAVGVALGVALPTGGSHAPSSPVHLAPSATVGDFFANYVTASGRVVRTDQGGDTVSEGQAYAMLMAASMGERDRFTSVWSWTEHHLLLPDGLLAWHWEGGRVVDPQPASDADLTAAAALVTASRRFGDASLLSAARTMSGAILAHEVAASGEGPTLVAGPWAVAPTEYVDPSYLAPAELDDLAKSFGGSWTSIASTASVQLQNLTAGGDLPSDWAVVGPDHLIHPSAPPTQPGRAANFGFDAVRAPIWMATSCDPGVRAAASGLRGALQRGGGQVNLDLGGHPAPGTTVAVGHLAVAAGQWAAGADRQAWADVEAAAKANRAHPTYYGTAWVALTTMAFDRLLEACAA